MNIGPVYAGLPRAHTASRPGIRPVLTALYSSSRPRTLGPAFKRRLNTATHVVLNIGTVSAFWASKAMS